MGGHNNQIKTGYEVTIHINDGKVEHTIGGINIDPSKKGAFFNDYIRKYFENIYMKKYGTSELKKYFDIADVKKLGEGELEIYATPKDKKLSFNRFFDEVSKYTSNDENMTDKIKKSLKTAKGYNVDWGNFDRTTKVKANEHGGLVPTNENQIIDANDQLAREKLMKIISKLTQEKLMEIGARESK